MRTKTTRQASKKKDRTVEADAGAAAGSILYCKIPFMRLANCVLCCLMPLCGLRHGSNMVSNQGSRHGHSHGRVEAGIMVLASLQFAR